MFKLRKTMHASSMKHSQECVF